MTFREWVPIITALVSVFGASGVALLTAFLAKRARKDALALKLVEAKLKIYESIQALVLVCVRDVGLLHTSQRVRVDSEDPAGEAIASIIELDAAVKAGAHLLSAGYLKALERLHAVSGEVLSSSGKDDEAWNGRLSRIFDLHGDLVNEIRKDLGTDALGEHVLRLLGPGSASGLSQKVGAQNPAALPSKAGTGS